MIADGFTMRQDKDTFWSLSVLLWRLI